MSAPRDSSGGPPTAGELRIDDYSPFVWTVSKNAVKVFAWIWFRLTWRDRHHVPATGPVVLAPNHSSYLDPLLAGCSPKRRVRFLAQKGLARFGPMRWWLRKVGVRLIDRDAPSKEVLRSLITELKAGNCVSVFPEGTRSADGSIGPFRSGVEFLVRRTGAVVVPVGIRGSHKAFGRGASFVWPRHCEVHFGPPWAPDRVLAPGGLEALRREISRLSGQPLRESLAQPAGASAPAPASAAGAGAEVGPGPGGRTVDPSCSVEGASSGDHDDAAAAATIDPSNSAGGKA